MPFQIYHHAVTMDTTSAPQADRSAAMQHPGAILSNLPKDAMAHCDVFVIGAGPAGSTTATLLARAGLKVVMVDKCRHPRFHIGESLLPHNLPLLDRLGLRHTMEDTAMRKHGIEFVSPYHDHTVRFDFAHGLDKRFPYSFQVRRSDFDNMLVRNAAANGVEVIEECRVTDVALDAPDASMITARLADGRVQNWQARFVVDASGRDTLLANKLGLKTRNPHNNSAALFGHFTNARRLTGRDEGHISIIWFEHGWFWFIPLSDGTTSVGAVCPAEVFKTRGTDLETFFRSLIALSPELQDRLKNATLQGEVTATGNYSYFTSCAIGSRYLLAGDAAAFIDPVFSTGVYLAMNSGFEAAEAVQACLKSPTRSNKWLKRYEKRTRKIASAFTWFIYRIREPAMRNLFMSPRNVFRVEEAVVGLLAGDSFGGWQLWIRLYFFRFLYYTTKLSHLGARLIKKPYENSKILHPLAEN